jgi:hypothetical protein
MNELQPPLRIGFDLDGVILYNPVRIFRPVVAFAKSKLLKKKTIKFYVPKTRAEKLVWWCIHKSSFFVAPGFSDIIKLLQENNIEAYIITARFGSLQKDFENWMKKINASQYFEEYFHNPNNEQPHEYKKRMIEKLKLDMFIDDNWDIVNYLSTELKDKQILWITNLFDNNITYPHKYSNLKRVAAYLQEITRKKVS